MRNKFVIFSVLLMFVTINQLDSQITKNLFICANIGKADIWGDVGSTKYTFNEPGLNAEINLIKRLDIGLNVGVGYQFDYIQNDDKNSLNTFRGYILTTYIHEAEIVFNYNILRLFFDNNFPLRISIGGITSYYISKNQINKPLQTRYDRFKSSDNGIIIYPNISVSYDIKSFQFGLNSRLGYSNSDYLEGFSTDFSKMNDRVFIISFLIGYKIN